MILATDTLIGMLIAISRAVIIPTTTRGTGYLGTGCASAAITNGRPITRRGVIIDAITVTASGSAAIMAVSGTVIGDRTLLRRAH